MGRNDYRDPPVCGGTDKSIDADAPKEIISDEIVQFSFSGVMENIFLTAFAVPAGEGSFVFLEKNGFDSREKPERRWALVRERVFPALAALTKELNLAAYNGYRSFTHGLPRNFGGTVSIKYASGENIYFSNNQSRVFSVEQGRRVVEFFEKALRLEPMPLRKAEDIASIRYRKDGKNGAFTNAELTIQPDGSGINRKKTRFDDPTVYDSEKQVSAETVAAILRGIDASALLAWGLLPQGYSFGDRKTLTFTFRDGEAVTVPNARLVPESMNDAFFKVELELVTKN